MNSIPYGRQDINSDDIKSVVNVLKSNYLTQGPEISIFENEFAKYVSSKYAVAVSNGTAALHLCALALNIKPGDKIITTPITFAASANCIRYCGGEVVFVDIDPETYLIDTKKLSKLLNNSKKGEYKGVIPVDFSGRSNNFEEIKKIADKHKLWIIEDSCHAPGAYFKDSKGIKQFCGNGVYTDLSIFSFHPVKHIATGEGGMITTNNKNLYDKLIELRTHGITKDESKFQNSISLATGELSSNSYPNWYMEMQKLGFNYRLTDFQAALGTSQLKRAKKGLIRRKEIAKIYFNAFKNSNFVIRQSGLHEGHAYHLYILEVKNRLGLYDFLRENKIYAQIHYFPCHLMPYYRGLGNNQGDFPSSENYYKNCISLPIYPTLKSTEQDYVINKIKLFYTK